MTEYCQNGWPITGRLFTFRIPHANRRLTLHNSWAGYLLADLANQFDKRIQRLDPPGNEPVDEGGYVKRRIAGTNVWSNHADGLAEDLNWNAHAYSVEDTFTTEEVREIHRLLAKRYRGVIRWGGDYRNTKDEMHFEIVGTPADCRRVARFVRWTPRGRNLVRVNPGLRTEMRKW